MYMTCFDY